MFTPWNSSSACLLARSDRIGGDRLDLLNLGDVIPPGLHAPYVLCYALCSMRHACYSTGVQSFFKQVSHKAPPAHKEGGAFCFARGSPILQ